MKSTICTLLLTFLLVSPTRGAASEPPEPPRFELELEVGPVWQGNNDVQIPNDDTGTRFSLVDVLGNGPWPAGRAYVTWNISSRHSLRALAAPLSVTETGELPATTGFAGETYDTGVPKEAQGDISSEKTDVGFVPLLHIAGWFRFAEGWRLALDLDALAGGPDRYQNRANRKTQAITTTGPISPINRPDGRNSRAWISPVA